jgi:F-type H+-transporting ATPase subunit a
MHEEIILWHLGNMTFHGKTLVMTWLSMVLLIIFCLCGVRHLTSDKPGKMQNVLEWIVDFIRGLISDTMDYNKGRPLLTYLTSLIMFILFSNMLGLVPNFAWALFKHVEFAELNEIFKGIALQSPTADVNTTMALALMTITIVLFLGIKHKKLHYFHHFIEPNPVFLPIHIIDFLAKPMTLAFRLFGNIFAGEVLIQVILMIPGALIFAFVLPDTLWLGYSIFVGCIQSYVFTILTVVYVGQAVSEH